MKRTVETLKASGHLTLNELVQQLADEGIFLGRSAVRTIRFYQHSGRIPRPVHAGKGNISYYPADTVAKIVAIRRRPRIGGTPVEDIEAEPFMEMMFRAAEAYFTSQSPARQRELISKTISEVYPVSKDLARILGTRKPRGGPFRWTFATHITSKMWRDLQANLTLKTRGTQRAAALRLPLWALVKVIQDQIPEDKFTDFLLSGRANAAPASEDDTEGWTDVKAYLAWSLIKKHDMLRKLMLAGDFERAYRGIAWSCQTIVPMATKFLEQHFRNPKPKKGEIETPAHS